MKYPVVQCEIKPKIFNIFKRNCCIYMSITRKNREMNLKTNYGIQSGPKKCVHSLLINIFGINLNEISISGCVYT